MNIFSIYKSARISWPGHYICSRKTSLTESRRRVLFLCFSVWGRLELEKGMGLKRFAVLLCAEDSEYVKRQYGGYYGVYKGLLAEEGEVWDVYRVAAGELPDDGEIGLYDGFVITGSCSNAHGDDAWICQLINLLKKLDFMKKKVLGICFGHQVIITINKKNRSFLLPHRIVIASPILMDCPLHSFLRLFLRGKKVDQSLIYHLDPMRKMSRRTL